MADRDYKAFIVEGEAREEKDERTVQEVLDDMQAESDGIAAAVSKLKELLGGIEI